MDKVNIIFISSFPQKSFSYGLLSYPCSLGHRSIRLYRYTLLNFNLNGLAIIIFHSLQFILQQSYILDEFIFQIFPK